MTFFDKLRRSLRIIRTPPPSPPVSAPTPASIEQWGDQVRATGQTIDGWIVTRRARGRLYADLSDAAIDRIRSRWPERTRATRAAADTICGHVFDLLGSGPTLIADPDRPVDANGYRPIDWAVDPIAALRFPTGFPHKQWTAEMRPGLADIKWPWEIGRCQHWVTLGQAYRLTGDERYAVEIVRQHADFMAANPIGIGVQFVCTMDVAIRAMNWALAFELIRQSAAFDAAAMTSAYRSLFDVGVFIEGNLENKYEVTSNHFLSNVVGLYGVGLALSDLAAGQRWSRQCREWLEQEMKVQVLPDGADYESSVPYHRLVAELFLGGARMAELEGTALSPEYLARLKQMIEFHCAVLRPDGLMPQIGDADDGRLHIFTDYGTWQPQDGRHLAGAAAIVLGDSSWLAAGGDTASWEAAWWADRDVPEVASSATPAVARLFPDAGLAIYRRDGTYLLVSNGRVGTNGFGNHKHNDLLSFEFHAAGTPLIVDAGSYVYTSNPEARNLFRSTGFHNTAAVDGVEQNDVRPDYLFRMFETSVVEHAGLHEDEAAFEYTGRHTGYVRLPEPVTHERQFRLSKGTDVLMISDRFGGQGRHTLTWHLHVAPGVSVAPSGDGGFRLSAGAKSWTLRVPDGLTAAVSDSWYSPSYGVRVRCRAIDFSMQTILAGEQRFEFELGPQRG